MKFSAGSKLLHCYQVSPVKLFPLGDMTRLTQDFIDLYKLLNTSLHYFDGLYNATLLRDYCYIEFYINPVRSETVGASHH